MLFDILSVVLVVYVMILPFILFGMVSALIGKPTAPVLPKRKKKKPQISPKDQRIIDILANIDAYDGTSKGQKPIKE